MENQDIAETKKERKKNTIRTQRNIHVLKKTHPNTHTYTHTGIHFALRAHGKYFEDSANFDKSG